MKKIVVRGFKKDKFTPEEIQNAKDSKLELKGSYQFSTSRAVAEVHKLEFDKTDILEFVFDDDTTWVGGSDIIHDIFPEAADQKRGVDESFEIPMYLKTDEANRSLLGDIALKALNVFAKKAVTQKVIEIAARLEKKALENMSGVYAINADFKLGKATVKNADKPYLLFLHGTNSSTVGSFGELRGSELWKNMLQIYGQNIIGLQHETMTKSPIQNVINLFKELPDVCTLHVISHSRGGLVGDVLARFCNDNAGFTDLEIAYLAKTERATDIADIKALQKIITDRKMKISVDKFIRVACPAYGTTVLSKRLDHFLNISFNLLSTLFGPAAALVSAEFKELISAAVDTKNDPDQLPGLEAMNPASPFLKVLNNPDTIINSPLTVISGNCGIKFNLKALLIIASKLFYMRDNDLVVDTKSMYCGTRRNIPVQYFFDEGAEVDHVHYFKNKKTQDALLLAIKTVTVTIPNFTSFEQSVQAALDRNALLGLDGGGVYMDKVTGKKPIAIMLPGIMGSNLDQGSKKIWINYLRFLVGDLSKLDISRKDISASSIIKTSYKKLADYLSTDYDVVTFAFDWRLPLSDAAALLKTKIEQYLAFKVPIKIIGHSMGGVVTRDFIINHPATWKKLNASKDFKLLLLGAPLGGSYRIPYVLAGKDPIISQLSKIDLKHTKKELLDMFRKFPGLLALLPVAKDTVDFADQNVWQQMRNASLFDWNIPDKIDLQFWGAYRDNVLAKMDSIELDNIIYIAGKDDATVCGFEINNNLPDEKIIFKSTAEGDQSVTWDTGIPKKLSGTDRLYFVNVSHGGLANNADIFNGISEILKNGKTELLSKNRPLLRGAQSLFDTVEEEVYDTGEAGLENTILGIKEKKVAEKTNEVPLKIGVSNGDLFYSRYPIMVGHFINDGITSAEKVIDINTHNQLSQRHRLNMYPGAIGSNEVFVNFNDDFKGTVVIGLGVPGRLSSYQLAQTTEQGVIKYMLELSKLYKTNGPDYLPAETGISALLIGCGYGGLSIESSIRAIILGVQNANKKMQEFSAEGLKPIERVEFVELFEDRCLQCLYILSRIENEEDSTINIRLPKKQYKKLLGSRTRIPMENETDWWSRITVQLHEEEKCEDGEEAESALRFACSTGSAREEERDLQTSPEIINELVEEMSTNNKWNAGMAKTLFELLIPNDFKDEIKKQSNSLWVLDHAAASYPWELLQDSTSNARPLCCNAGMIRQLKLEDYRIKVDAVAGRKALVIGDPDLNGFPYAKQLPGAFKEANMVASVLDEYGYEMPNNCFKKSSTQIINALFKDEYKIIHLAGHGIFNEKRPRASGMLIGNGVFLSTKEICQMSKVPELVFVNCCFLGKVDSTSEALFSKRYKLAANIGTQLITNGVKVVIAAGWAVDDAAALYFTGIFYHAILDGYNFGEAVKKAREKTFGRYPNTNTWGAYQCYGDPFFKLSDKKVKPEPKKYLIAQEAENDFSNLINTCDTKSASVKSILSNITTIATAVDAAGIRNAAITEREAMAYAECNDYENAIAKFESLLGLEQAGFSLKALEKYCNLRSKLCVKNWQTGKEKNKQPAKMDKVIADLKQLINMSPTAERLSLMGSAYKRKAMISTTNTDKVKALITAAGYYRQAFDMPQNSNKTYALTNWLEIERILSLVKTKPGVSSLFKKYKFALPQKAKADIADAIKKMINAEADMDYWNEIAKANALLCAWLMEGKDTKEFTGKMFTDAYKKVWGIAGSQNKKVSEVEHFDFLIEAYTGLVKKPANVIAIKKIKKDLENIIK